MTTQIFSAPMEGVVQEMRNIRNQISNEIKEMTFEEERAYLDKLLAEKQYTESENTSKANNDV